MPTYEYSCFECGYEFSIKQGIKAKVLRTCRECRKKSLIRKITGGAGVIFKGQGFYSKDYNARNASDGAKS